MSAATLSDGGAQPDDGLPVVAERGGREWGPWIFAIILVIGGIALFSVLSAGREAANVPATLAPAPDPSSRIASPPPLAVPAGYDPAYGRPVFYADRAASGPFSGAQASYQPQAPIRAVQAPVSPPAPAQNYYQPPPPSAYLPPPPQVVFDAGRNSPGSDAAPAAGAVTRVKAERFTNPSMTIPQGTVIPAVLETALDSTRPGGVRALVQGDISSFDGSRVLIQRGSRLYGEYEAGLDAGQKRALVRWTRLIRPDGVTIALDSPASDPLGRAGIRGKVDSKFFARFGSAILQSVLDIGVGVATREATNGVIVALPGSTQNVAGQGQQQVQSTLTVKHGTSVSVFVARDLDFSSVEY